MHSITAGARLAGALATVSVLVACELPPAAQPGSDAPRPTIVALDVVPVPLDPADPSQRTLGRFTFAGGVELNGRGPGRFGGLSDLEVHDGRMFAVTDEGLFVEGRLVLDADGQLTGVDRLTTVPLAGEDGRPLVDKTWADAEGLVVLPGGDRLVSFERRHRIWRYPVGGGPPVTAPAPAEAASFPLNGGLEALTARGTAHADSYLAGSEGGDVWQCHLRAGCRPTALGVRVPEGFGLTALAVSPDGETIALAARLYDPVRGVRVIVRLLPAGAVDSTSAATLDELTLAPPLTRDNFEGLALVPRPGGLRLYLLSDNNYSASQHTYLLAFDWSRGR